MCAAQTRSVYHVFMIEYTQVTQLHQNLCLCSINTAVSIASLVCSCTSEKRRRVAKGVAGHFAGCCLPIFLLLCFWFCFVCLLVFLFGFCLFWFWFLFLFFLGPAFGVFAPHSFTSAKCTLQKRGEGWLCLWSLHSPDTLLLKCQCRCSRLLKFCALHERWKLCKNLALAKGPQ